MIIAPPGLPKLSSADWDIDRPAQVNRGEFTGRRRVTQLTAAPRWYATAALPPIVGEENVLAWRAWLVDLDGQANSFPLVAVQGVQIGGVAPTCSSAGQIGTSIASAGWGAAGIKLLRGQFVTIDGQLLCLMADVVAAADGSAMLSFKPYIRLPTTLGAPITVDRPYALMSMSNSRNGWKAAIGHEYAISFECEESFR